MASLARALRFFLAKHDATLSMPNQGRRFDPDTKEELSGLNQIMSYRI
jgi:hypothetical protein